ncbi:hypothetical protein V500_03434 [Pseudogymnoascus sp. VKM F-4518 (FW-2643)]|nr:hypothetical protein V500_03434 [Pseudogymnoascus sp. VKM F-4518 (FW-2643)]
MAYEKSPLDDSATETLKSASPSLSEKGSLAEAEKLGAVHSSSLTPPAKKDKHDLNKVISAKEAQQELDRIMTCGEGVEYPTGIKLSLVTLALCLNVGWYGSAYLLTTASFQLLFGKIYTYFSIKWVYLIAIGIFEIGSLICGAAPNSIALIIGRAVAGVGSAGIFSGALIIVAYTVPLVKRPMYTGFIGAMYGIASVAGPLLGGVFTDKATWRWCFYINLPLGAITIIVIMTFFTNPERKAIAKLGWKARIQEFDLQGNLVFIPAIICLLLALQWGGTKHPWGNWRIILLFVFFSLLIGGFIGIQFWKQDQATVPPRIIKQRSLWSAAYFSFAMGSFFLLLIYYLPIWFQAVKGVSAIKSGIMNLPMILTRVIVSVISGIIVTVVGYYAPLMIASSVLCGIGCGLLYTLTPESNHSLWIGYQAITGIGIGLGMQQPLVAVQTVLDISDVPIGTSIIIFAQTLGGALFVSIGQNVFTNKLVEGVATYAPNIDPLIILSTGATSIQSSVAKDVLPGVTLAYSNALTKSFLVAAAMAATTIIGSLAIEWKSVKGKNIEMAAA